MPKDDIKKIMNQLADVINNAKKTKNMSEKNDYDGIIKRRDEDIDALKLKLSVEYSKVFEDKKKLLVIEEKLRKKKVYRNVVVVDNIIIGKHINCLTKAKQGFEFQLKTQPKEHEFLLRMP